MKEIMLDIPNTFSGLAGNKYGRKIYDEQVAGKIDDFKDVVIVFPDNITDIATSFLQGFFKIPVDSIGVEGIMKNFTYKSHIPELENVVRTALVTMR